MESWLRALQVEAMLPNLGWPVVFVLLSLPNPRLSVDFLLDRWRLGQQMVVGSVHMQPMYGHVAGNMHRELVLYSKVSLHYTCLL